MDRLSNEDLRSLLEHGDGPCVSVYVPTHRGGAAVREDPIRLKNLLREVADELEGRGMRKTAIEEFLSPAWRVQRDLPGREDHSDGLCLFVSREGSRHWRLPLAFEPLALVGERYHVKPLLPLFTGDGRFYVLAVSQKDARLLQGTHHSVCAVETPGLPKGLREALHLDDAGRKALQFHSGTGASAGGGRRAAMFHGQGAGHDDVRELVVKYFRGIDKALRPLLMPERAPLVLAMVGHLMPAYREANTYPQLVEGGVAGSPDRLSGRELHDRAWPLVEPIFTRSQEAAARRFAELRQNGRALDDLKAVVPAAVGGRVETLFVPRSGQVWGCLEGGSAVLHEEAQPGDTDLLDMAAVHTLLHDGTVYAREPASMPEGAKVAAILRY
jgi:hypothetical protein